MLSNPSFEEPAVPFGDNFRQSIPGWTVATTSNRPDQPAESVNVVRPGPGYGTGPQSTPSGGGDQYLDIRDADATLQQVFIVRGPGTISFGASFSQRDAPHAIPRIAIRLVDETGGLVSETYASFDGGDPIETWKSVGSDGIRVGPGRYTIAIDLPDSANVDKVTVMYAADNPGRLTMTKSVRTLADPLNRTVNPLAIPGATMAYTIEVENVGDTEIDPDTQVLEDATPNHMAFWAGDRFPVTFRAGDSGLTLRYGGRSDPNDDVEFSMDGGGTWTYSPNTTKDEMVTNVRFRPKGAMKPGTRYSIDVPYVIL